MENAKYFKNFVDKINTQTTISGSGIGILNQNDYYSPQLFLILSDISYILPRWSGIILFSWQSLYPNKFEKFSRLTNNPVENWFRILKHNILKEKQKPSVHSTKVLRKLLYEYYKNYEKIDQRSFDSIFGKETHNRKSDECEEKWSKKKVKKRTKGFYFSDDISFCNKNQNLMSSNNFDQHIRAIFDIEKEDSDTGMSQN